MPSFMMLRLQMKKISDLEQTDKQTNKQTDNEVYIYRYMWIAISVSSCPYSLSSSSSILLSNYASTVHLLFILPFFFFFSSCPTLSLLFPSFHLVVLLIFHLISLFQQTTLHKHIPQCVNLTSSLVPTTATVPEYHSVSLPLPNVTVQETAGMGLMRLLEYAVSWLCH